MSAESKSSSKHSRLVALDYTRAFAILLVVAGHWNPPPEPLWWYQCFRIIYTFHMPLFLAISGFLYMYTRKQKGYLSFLKGKFNRLMIPYFFTSLIIITIKLLSQNTAYVEHPVNLLTYLEILYSPSAGYFLWFMWALWWMFVIIPFFKSRKTRTILFLVSFVLHFMPWSATDIFCLWQTQRMLVYFMCGIMLYDWKHLIPTNTKCWAFILGCLFIVLEVAYVYDIDWTKYILAFISIPLFPALFRVIEPSVSKNQHRLLMTISSASFFIYLFHTTFDGFVKSAARPLLSLNNDLVYALLIIVAVAVGTIIPTWLAIKVLNRWKLTRWMFGLK